MGSTDPPGLRRLCLVRDPAKPRRWGSGFAVKPYLVLTCAHVVGPPGSPCEITPYGRAKLTGRVIWVGRQDAALITIDGPSPWDGEQFPPRFGELAAEAGCVTYGYPIVRKVGEKCYHEHRRWQAMPTTGAETGRYLLSTPHGEPRDRTPDPETGEYRSPWAGLSGAAVLSPDETVVLGLVVVDPVRYRGSVEAIRASALVAEPGFAELVDPGELVRWPPAEEPALGEGIVRHSDEVAGLAGMRENLMESRLPFVPPPDDADTHPRRLLELLADPADDRGVLLVGAAGVGKTRTCFEVGARAEAAGWTVLHLRSGDPGVTAEQLGAAIAATGGDVLVIIDYLNECDDLSLSALHSRVLPDARRTGRRVALLASARTAWALRNGTDPDVSRLFRRIELAPGEEHSRRIRDKIIETLAARARRVLGDERLAELCGTRPAIAMLIATELEARAARHALTADNPGGRSGVLVEWLLRRLAEDGLTAEPPSGDLFADNAPPDHLQAITAMIAVTPQRERNLLACGANVLGRAAGEDDEYVRHLLALLRNMGWLVDDSQGLGPVHDIVADQLLERCLLRPGSDLPRGRVLDRLLSSAAGTALGLGRFATNLGRLMRELEAEGRSGRLERSCADWLGERAAQVGAVLAERPAEGAVALGALLRNPAWNPVVLTRWAELAEPWFERHGGTVSALRLLENGLRAIGAAHGPWLSRIAIRLLAARPPRPDEDGLLCALLAVPDLGGNDLAATIELAFRWLRRYGMRDYASFLLVALLRRDDLLPDTLRTVGNRAVAWFERNDASAGAGRVLRAMLERPGLAHDESVAVAVRLAFDRVTAAPTELTTSFLLAPLIGHPAVPADQQERLWEIARAWLAEHGDTMEARFVLNRLIHAGVNPEVVDGLAFGWLREHGPAYYARPVILGLLDRCRGESRRAAIGHALTWLGRHPERPDGSYLLERLIEIDGEHTADAVRHALDWLGRHGTEDVASYVLAALLTHPGRELPDAAAVASIACRWLRQGRHGEAFEARFVLAALLKRLALVPGEAEAVVSIAFRWLGLERNGAAFEASFVLAPLLGHAELEPPEVEAVVSFAFRWLGLERYGEAFEARFVLAPLLGRTDLGEGAVAEGTAAAFRWLDRHRAERKASPVLVALLERGDLGDAAARRVVAEAVTWLDHHHTDADAFQVFLPLLRHPLLRDGQRVALAQGIIAWFDANDDASVGDLPALLLADGALPEPVRTALADRMIVRTGAARRLNWPLRYGSADLAVKTGLSWLATHRGRHVDRVVRALAERPDLTAGQLAEVVAHAIDWFRGRDPGWPHMTALYSLCPRFGDLSDGQLGAVAGEALRCLDAGVWHVGTGAVLAALLGEDRLGGPVLSRVRAHADAWLADRPDDPHAEALRAAVAGYDRRGGRAAGAADTAGRASGRAGCGG